MEKFISCSPLASLNMRSKNGFTLIEILVVLFVLGVVVTVTTGLFFSLLRSSKKAKVIAEVKQNGDFAMTVMERMIRNAQSLEEPVDSGFTNKIKILNPDNGETIFACQGAEQRIASNDADLLSESVKVEDCTSVFNVFKGASGARPDRVVIEFTLSQAEVTTRVEEQATVDFFTTVSLRNY